MFRKGGNVGEGIMTGIVDRSNYENGTVPELGELTEQNIQALLKAAGPSQESDPLTTFLLQYGPALAQQRGGSTLGNIVAAAEKPIASMLESKRRESDFSRGLKIQAAGSAIKQRSEMESAERDILFKQELADKAADLQRDLSQAEIVAAKERADAQYLQNLELQSKKAADEYKMRSNLLREADLLEQQTSGEKIQTYALFFVRYVYSNLSKFSSVPGRAPMFDFFSIMLDVAAISISFVKNPFVVPSTLTRNFSPFKSNADVTNRLYF